MQNFKIATRNLFRHKYRTYLTGLAIAVIAFISVFGLSVAKGISNGLINNIISLNTGHITVNIKTNAKSNDTSAQIANWNKQILPYAKDLSADIEKIDNVKYTAKRVNINGVMISKEKTSNGVFVGIEPSKEQDLLREGIPVKEGRILPNESDENLIYISSTTAELYNVDIGDDLTIVCQTTDFIQNSMKFKVCGIFKKSAWKESYSYIYLSDAQSLTGLGEDVTQIKVMLSDRIHSEDVEEQINMQLGEKYNIIARNWRVAGEFFLGTVTIIEASVYGMCFVLFLLVILILVNIMAMAVYERTNEIGILMAMGTSKLRIFMLYMTEAFMLSAVATGLGEALGSIAATTLSKVGIPAFFEVMRLGFGADYAYPELKLGYVVISFCTIVFLSLLVTTIPIMKATKLEPVEAINYTL